MLHSIEKSVHLSPINQYNDVLSSRVEGHLGNHEDLVVEDNKLLLLHLFARVRFLH